MDELVEYLRKVAEAKAAYRQKRAQLPYPEKVRIVVKLQERRAPIIRARGGNPRVWKLKMQQEP